MFNEDDLLPISALQHLAFCERQWGLMHLEQQWSENRWTAEGRIMHERVHEGENEVRDGVRICRGLRLRSLELGLTGQADVVEFRPEPFPVEYKRGHVKPDQRDEVQLCAQALCLEEMLGGKVKAGALYYGEPRRRFDVAISEELRTQTKELARRLHQLTAAGRTPAAVYSSKCKACSLIDQCLPKAAGMGKSALRYLDRALAQSLQDDRGEA